MAADDGSTKGVATTIPAVNRHGRSRPALYRAELATGTRAQWSFHALRAHPGLGSAHLSGQATRMLRDGAPSWRERGRSQVVDQAQYVGEQASRDCDLGELERDIPTVGNG